MVAWLEHAECQLQAVDQFFFAVYKFTHIAGCPLSTLWERSQLLFARSAALTLVCNLLLTSVTVQPNSVNQMPPPFLNLVTQYPQPTQPSLSSTVTYPPHLQSNYTLSHPYGPTATRPFFPPVRHAYPSHQLAFNHCAVFPGTCSSQQPRDQALFDSSHQHIASTTIGRSAIHPTPPWRLNWDILPWSRCSIPNKTSVSPTLNFNFACQPRSMQIDQSFTHKACESNQIF